MRFIFFLLLSLLALGPSNANERLKTATEAISREFGIPMVGGYLLHPGYANGGDFHNDAVRLKQQNLDILNRWRLYISVFNYLNNPERHRNSSKIADLVLNEQEKLFALNEFGIARALERHGKLNQDRLVRSFSLGLRELNEFDRKRFNAWMRTTTESKYPSARTRSVLIASVGSVRFKKYDFSNRIMPISVSDFFNMGGLLPVSTIGDARFRVIFLERAWKPAMGMDPNIAEMIVGATDQRFRSVYLTVRGRLDLYAHKKRNSSNPISGFAFDSVYMSYDPLGKHPVFAKLTVDDVTRDLVAEQAATAAANRDKERRAKERENAKAAAAEKARLVDFPNRKLDFLGVSLGMPVNQAIEVLKGRLGADVHVAVDSGALPKLPRHCRSTANQSGQVKFKKQADLRRRMAGQTSSAAQVTADINAQRDEFIASLPKDCQIALMSVFKVAAHISKDRGRDRDEFVLYASGIPGSSDEIVAVSRRISKKDVDFRQPLGQKYGDIAIKSRYVTTWFETADMHNYATENKQRLADCIADSPWPLANNFHFGLFKVDCGRYIASQKNSAYIVDTTYVLSAVNQIKEIAAQKTAEEPSIDF